MGNNHNNQPAPHPQYHAYPNLTKKSMMVCLSKKTMNIRYRKKFHIYFGNKKVRRSLMTKWKIRGVVVNGFTASEYLFNFNKLHGKKQLFEYYNSTEVKLKWLNTYHLWLYLNHTQTGRLCRFHLHVFI